MKPVSLLGLALLILLPVSWAHAAVDERPPNIVFLYADDLGYGDLACYGHPYAKTPNLDKLARQGTRFTQAYSTGVTCNPARTGYMTGKFPASFAKYTADFGFGKRVTITQLLKSHGYTTGHFGKWHIGPVKENGTYGIDSILAGKRSAQLGKDAGVYEQAIKFIKANKDKTFYINVWGHISHYAVNPPKHYAERFKGVKVNPSDFGPTMLEKFKQVRSLDKDVDAGMRNYLGEVASLDDAVGRLLKTLDKLGLTDNTIVVFSSDQGAAPVKFKKGVDDNPQFMANMLGSPGPFRGGKHDKLEGGVRTPFIVRWPGNTPANRVDKDSVISGVDWLPTLCAIAGIKIEPRDFDGEDVSNAWLGKTHERTKPLLWRNSSVGSNTAIRHGQWKLYTSRRAGKKAGPVELYDVIKDPLEQTNLADKRPEVVKQLKAKIKSWAATLPKQYFKDKRDKKTKRKERKNNNK